MEEIDRVAQRVEISLTEVLQRTDPQIGLADHDLSEGVIYAEERIAPARQSEVIGHSESVRSSARLRARAVERLTRALALPHPYDNDTEARRLHPSDDTEMTTMGVVMEYEEAQGRKVYDVHEENLGYDVTSLAVESGELRLIEVKDLAAADGSILLSPTGAKRGGR